MRYLVKRVTSNLDKRTYYAFTDFKQLDKIKVGEYKYQLITDEDVHEDDVLLDGIARNLKLAGLIYASKIVDVVTQYINFKNMEIPLLHYRLSRELSTITIKYNVLIPTIIKTYNICVYNKTTTSIMLEHVATGVRGVTKSVLLPSFSITSKRDVNSLLLPFNPLSEIKGFTASTLAQVTTVHVDKLFYNGSCGTYECIKHVKGSR